MQPEDPYIETEGTAEMEVDPDRIFISIHLSENNTKGKKSVEQQEKELIEAIQKNGLDVKKLSVTDASAIYGSTSFWSKGVIQNKQFEFEAANASETKKIFMLLDNIGVSNANITRVDHSKMEDFKKEIKVKAIKSAKTKATYLLDAIGEKLGKPTVVRENNYYVENVNYRNQGMIMSMSAPMDKEEARQPEIEFKKIKIKSSIYVKWKILL